MKRHLTLALLAAFALSILSACTGKQDEAAAPAPDAAPTAAAPNEAELMAAAEAAAKASADPNAAPAPATDPAATPAPAEAAPAAAAGDAIPGLKLGVDYAIIENGQPFEPLNGKVEVVEVFNYVCPACAGFQPLVVSWKKKLPASVRFTYVPAAFGGNWDQYVRSFYAAQTMGIAEKAHERVYDGIHLENKLKGERGNDSDAEIAAFYAQFGVDAKQFAGNMKSFAVTGKFNKAKQYIVTQRVGSTPTLMVNGKYSVLGRSAEDRFRIVDALIAHELARTAAPATP
jgi:protein dithiol oxidoreductase (disulfide-forming)